jgi:predicted nucleic acid-binding Zn ribbon protein
LYSSSDGNGILKRKTGKVGNIYKGSHCFGIDRRQKQEGSKRLVQVIQKD